MANKPECTVCCEKINKTTRKQVICKYCNYLACMQCVKRYILDSVEDPHCMNCKKGWDYEYMTMIFTKTFMNKEYTTKRQHVLVEREKAMLPATQPDAERIIRQKKNNEKVRELYMQMTELRIEINRLKYHVDIECPKEEKKVFIKKCPISGCNGYLSSKWKCGLCKTYICKDCNEVRGNPEEHKCDPALVETIRLISKECKPCPKCSEVIYKIDGCDQIWCVTCHTAFDFTTGKIATGRIHNPHYFEWLRTHQGHVPRELNDGCGGYIDIQDHILENKVRQMYGSHYGTINGTCLLYMPQFLRHIERHEIERLRRNVDNTFEYNKNLRIKFLLSDITEEEWRAKLYKNEKDRRRERCILQILEMFYTVGSESLNRDLTAPELLHEIEELMMYVNKEFDKACTVYKSVNFPRILKRSVDKINRYNDAYLLVYSHSKFMKDVDYNLVGLASHEVK